MKIKDFYEKARIGSTVIYKSQAVRVEDILRREHTAKLNREGGHRTRKGYTMKYESKE